MDNEKIPRGIDALCELLIQFDELGYQPTVPVEIGAQEHAEEFKRRLIVAVGEYVGRTLKNFTWRLAGRFDIEEIFDFTYDYFSRFSFSDQLKNIGLERDESIQQLSRDLFGVAGSRSIDSLVLAEALYNAGYRKQEINHETEK